MSAGMICLQMDDGLYMTEAKSLLTWNTPGKPQTLCMWWTDIQFCLKDVLFFAGYSLSQWYMGIFHSFTVWWILSITLSEPSLLRVFSMYIVFDIFFYSILLKARYKVNGSSHYFY